MLGQRFLRLRRDGGTFAIIPVLSGQEGPPQTLQGRGEEPRACPSPSLDFFPAAPNRPRRKPRNDRSRFRLRFAHEQEEERVLPCVVPAVRLQEIHISVSGEKRHQLVVCPVEMSREESQGPPETMEGWVLAPLFATENKIPLFTPRGRIRHILS